MLPEIAAKLDAWVVARNVVARSEGTASLRPCRIRLLGQMALFEANTRLELNLTSDVDVHADYEHAIEAEFRRLLGEVGLSLDPAGHEVWMPRETRYVDAYVGEYVTLQIADADAVLVSKAIKAPTKNRNLIVEYLSLGASERFFMLAERYRLDLEHFL